jgi:hypothetical protein
MSTEKKEARQMGRKDAPWSKTGEISRWHRRVVAAMALSAGVLIAVGSLPPRASGSTPAVAASTFFLNETGRLHLTSKHEFTLNEQGSGSGTIMGMIYVHLTVVSTSEVSAEVSMYPRGSSITGRATASYKRGHKQGSFSGSLSIVRGTGRYDRAHGSGLSFMGTIQRAGDAIAVDVRGSVSD